MINEGAESTRDIESMIQHASVYIVGLTRVASETFLSFLESASIFALCLAMEELNLFIFPRNQEQPG